jgi:integrase
MLSTYIAGAPWSEDFMRQYAAALDGVKAKASEIGANRTKAGTFDALCVFYYRTEFPRLKASTQRERRNIIERFRSRDGNGSKPVKLLERRHIKEIMAKLAATPEAANNLLKALRLLLNHAVDIGMIESNPAQGVKPYRHKGGGFHTWSAAEIAAYRDAHPLGTTARLALELLDGTGQRIGDVVRMGWQHFVRDADGEWLTVRQEKTDEPLWVALPPGLVEAMASVPRTNLTFLVTEAGAPFEAKRLSDAMRAWCDTAGLPECTAHGLRKAKLTRQAEAECTTEQMKATGGHRSTASLGIYTRAANQRRLARQALDNELRAEREQNQVQPKTRLDKSKG